MKPEKKDYEGPLYAKHPDLKKEEPPFDTEAYRHFKDVMDLPIHDDYSDPYGGH